MFDRQGKSSLRFVELEVHALEAEYPPTGMYCTLSETCAVHPAKARGKLSALKNHDTKDASDALNSYDSAKQFIFANKRVINEQSWS